MRLLQINAVVNSGSTGRIAEDIGRVALEHGYESYIAFGRGHRPSQSQLIRIGSPIDVYMHGVHSLLFDRHGFASKKATAQMVETIEKIQPDVIGLHNLHGYYLHIGVLFDYLQKTRIPVLWTLFDCWAFTGHCSYFDDVRCEKWISHCQQCPKSRSYPKSFIVDNSFQNFLEKRQLFSGLGNIELVVHSNWLAGLLKQSFLRAYSVHVIPSGIDLATFKPSRSDLRTKHGLEGKKVILGCANIWTSRKGYKDFMALRQRLDSSWQIVMIGLKSSEISQLPTGILGIERTESIIELAQWYTLADVFVNPTWQDNFPTTNIEALACGTAVVTYRTGGSPEAIDAHTGFVVEKGDIDGLSQAVQAVVESGKSVWLGACRQRAEVHFDKDRQYGKYFALYQQLLNA